MDRKGLSIGTVEKAQFNDYVSVDGQVVPISVVQISSEEGGIVLEKVVDEGAQDVYKRQKQARSGEAEGVIAISYSLTHQEGTRLQPSLMAKEQIDAVSYTHLS